MKIQPVSVIHRELVILIKMMLSIVVSTRRFIQLRITQSNTLNRILVKFKQLAKIHEEEDCPRLGKVLRDSLAIKAVAWALHSDRLIILPVILKAASTNTEFKPDPQQPLIKTKTSTAQMFKKKNQVAIKSCKHFSTQLRADEKNKL